MNRILNRNLLLLFISLSLGVASFALPPKNTGEIINILMMRGHSFEQSNVSGILNIIKKGNLESANYFLYQNLEMYLPLSHPNILKVLNVLQSLTPTQQLNVDTMRLLELVAQSIKLVDANAIEALRVIQNQAIDHETARLAASLILKYSPHHDDAIEKLKLLAQDSRENIIALNDLLKTSEHEWAYNKLLEIADTIEGGRRIAFLIETKRYNGTPTVEIVEKASKHLSVGEAQTFLFYVEADFKDVFDAYKAKKASCTNILKNGLS